MKLTKEKIQQERKQFEKYILEDWWAYAGKHNGRIKWRFFASQPALVCDLWIKTQNGGNLENGEVILSDVWRGWLARASMKGSALSNPQEKVRTMNQKRAHELLRMEKGAKGAENTKLQPTRRIRVGAQRARINGSALHSAHADAGGLGASRIVVSDAQDATVKFSAPAKSEYQRGYEQGKFDAEMDAARKPSADNLSRLMDECFKFVEIGDHITIERWRFKDGIKYQAIIYEEINDETGSIALHKGDYGNDCLEAVKNLLEKLKSEVKK